MRVGGHGLFAGLGVLRKGSLEGVEATTGPSVGRIKLRVRGSGRVACF